MKKPKTNLEILKGIRSDYELNQKARVFKDNRKCQYDKYPQKIYDYEGDEDVPNSLPEEK